MAMPILVGKSSPRKRILFACYACHEIFKFSLSEGARRNDERFDGYDSPCRGVTPSLDTYFDTVDRTISASVCAAASTISPRQPKGFRELY